MPIAPATGQQTLKPIPARTGFVAKAEPAVTLAEPGHQLLHRMSGRFSKTPTCRTSPPRPPSANCYANRRFVHIQPDIKVISSISAHPPCMRLFASAGHPAQPSTVCMPSGGPPISFANIGSSRLRKKSVYWPQITGIIPIA